MSQKYKVDCVTHSLIFRKIVIRNVFIAFHMLIFTVLNMSTSAQLGFQMNSAFVPPEPDRLSPIEYFPYFQGRYLAVAASLTGGNVMYSFVKLLQQWTHELGTNSLLLVLVGNLFCF